MPQGKHPAEAIAAPLATVTEALAEIRAGRMVVVVDDEDRENEGDLTIAAQHVTPEIVNFMARHGRGLICVAMTAERLEQLRIPLMTADNTSNFGTAFCESVDARAGVTTGISAADRARTILSLVEETTRPEDLARPGHIFPLRAMPGGVLSRAGQTEAAVDLARLAGLEPAGVICEIMNDDGTMARVPQLEDFCRRHGMRMLTVAALIRYRAERDRPLRRWAETNLETAWGPGRLVAYRSELDQQFHSALVIGQPDLTRPVLVRVQSHCLAPLLGVQLCRCGESLQLAMARVRRAGAGILVYLHQNGPGLNFPDTTGGRTIAHSQTAPRETVPEPARGSDEAQAVQREIGLGAQILSDLGVRQLRLLTDHPRRLAGLEGFGLELAEYVPLQGN